MLRAIITIGSLQFVTMLVMLVRTKALALLLGPELLGAMSVIDKLIAVISQTLSLSLPLVALRFLPEALRRGEEEFRDLYRNMMTLLLMLVVPATVVCVALALRMPAAFGAQLAPYRSLLVFAFLGLPVVAIVPFLTNAIAGRMWHDRSMTFSLAHATLLLVAAVGGGWLGGLRGIYAIYAALGAVFVIIAARWVVRGLPRHAPSRPLRVPHLPPLVWRFSFALLALAFAAPYATLFVHYSVFRVYGAESAGLLQAAVGLSLSIRTLLGSAHAVFLTPHVNRQATADERIAWAHTFQRTTCLVFMLLLPPLLLFPDLAIRVLYTPRFLPAASIAGLFIVSEVCTLLSGTYQSLILAGNHLRFQVMQNLIAQALLAAVASVLLPRVGLVGAGIATLVVPLYLFATTVWFLRRRVGFRMPGDVVRMTIAVGAAMVVCGVVGSHWRGVSGGLLVAKAGLCLGIIGLSLAALPRRDRAALREQLMVLMNPSRVATAPLEDASS
jgi:O-antigen/teichoic acid export membrane protein